MEITQMKDRANNLLNQITSKIDAWTTQDNSILAGRMGKMLYYFYLYNHNKDENYSQKATNLLEEVIDALKTKDKNSSYISSLGSGMSGFGLILIALKNDGILDADIDNILSSMDSIIYNGALRNIRENNTDFLFGASGSLHYFSKRIEANSHNVNEMVTKLVLELYNTTIKDIHGIRFKNDLINSSNGSKDINLGIAHGQCGILLVLLNIYNSGIGKNIIKELIEGGIKYLLSLKTSVEFDKSKYSFFPMTFDESFTCFSKENYKKYNGRMGWCYGDLNQALLLQRASNIFNNKEWMDLSDEIISSSILRTSIDETDNKDKETHFCHGTAGIIQFFKRLSENSDNKEINRACFDWLNKSMFFLEEELNDPEKNNKAGELLMGYVGTGLVFLSAISDQDLKWDNIFLLS